MAYPQTVFAATTIDGGSLIGRRREAVAANTLIYQLDVLKKTGRYDAFKLKWHPVYDEPPVVWQVIRERYQYLESSADTDPGQYRIISSGIAMSPNGLKEPAIS